VRRLFEIISLGPYQQVDIKITSGEERFERMQDFVWSKREYLFEKQFEIHSLAIKPHI
jgi:hypothetical protein